MSRENLAFVCAVLAGVILLFTIGRSRPDLLAEDGLVESLSAAGFAAASLLALNVAFRKSAFVTSTERSVLVGVSGLSLILFLSEISFGARIFGIRMPQMSGGGEFDGGHDIVMVVFRLLSDAGRTGLAMAATGAALLLAAGGVVLYLFRQPAQAIVRHFLSRSFEFRLAVSVCMLAGAVALDTAHKAAGLEEVLEFTASGVLILAVFALLWEKSALPVSGGKVPEQSTPVRRVRPAGIDHQHGVGFHHAKPPAREKIRRVTRRR